MNKIRNTAPVAILMATYNGEQYIAEQIESIQNQSFSNWVLYVQDDGSKDRTLEIVADYAKEDKRIKIIDVGLSRQGAGMNFMSMLNIIESEYYMFSDQDDVWFPEKIQKSLDRMFLEEKEHQDTPIIVHTSRTFTDSKLNVKLESEFNPRKESPEAVERKINLMKNKNILKIYTIVGGCTMLLNHKVKECVFPYCNIRVHDSVCVMAVAEKGGIISTIIEPTMYYRLHDAQTCGVRSNSLLPKIRNIFNTISGNMRGFYIWKIYGGGNFFKFLYWRIKYFLILRTL